jgi:hypothetical protein
MLRMLSYVLPSTDSKRTRPAGSPPSESTAACCEDGEEWRYFKVIWVSLWPSMSATSRMEWPAWSIRVAAVWRVSWKTMPPGVRMP